MLHLERVPDSNIKVTEYNENDLFRDFKEGKRITVQAEFSVGKNQYSGEFQIKNISNQRNLFTLKSLDNKRMYTVNRKNFTTFSVIDGAGDNNANQKKEHNEKNENQQGNETKDENSNAQQSLKVFDELKPYDKIKLMLKANMNNIWLVGPAGCGKSTIVRELAKEMNLPYYCISCGIGTSAAEFIGYKYPERQATKFAEYYAKPSIILIDEFTALDPMVGQVLNAALANGEIETTTGLVHRHKNCVIIATSNTFGNGADRQYVANNQLDASTIDRFVGAIIEMDYDLEYESQICNTEVLSYIALLRAVVHLNSMRKVISTRMVIAAMKLINNGVIDWEEILLTGWTDAEKMLVKAAKQNQQEVYRKVAEKRTLQLNKVS